MWLLVPPLYGTHAEVCLPVTQALLPAAVSAQSFSAYTSTPPLHRRDDTSLSLLLLSLSLSLSASLPLSVSLLLLRRRQWLHARPAAPVRLVRSAGRIVSCRSAGCSLLVYCVHNCHRTYHY